MALLFTKPDDSALTGIVFTIERGVPSAHQAVKVTNTGATPVSGAFITMYAEESPGIGDYVSTGHPVVDERMGRSSVGGVTQPMGHLAVAKLPTIAPGANITGDIWLEQGTPSVSGGAVSVKFEIAEDYKAIPIAGGISDIAKGVLTGLGQNEQFFVSGGAVTASGTPDDLANVAAVTSLYDGAEYTYGGGTVAFNQTDGNSEALAAGQKYIAAIYITTGSPQILKGARSATPVAPDTGVLPVLALVTVNYSAGATVINPADIAQDLTYGRLVVLAGTGLNVVVHAGKSIGGDFQQVHTFKETVPLTASATNRIWMDTNGQIVKTINDVPPTPTAHKLATATTDATSITSLVDNRTFVSAAGVLEPHAASHMGGADAMNAAGIGAADVSHAHAQADVTGLVAALAAKAALDSPVFVNSPTAPTPPAVEDSLRLANTAWVRDLMIGAVAPNPTKFALLTGTIDGSNKIFTVPEDYVAGSLGVFVGGILTDPANYTLSGTGNKTVTLGASVGAPADPEKMLGAWVPE